MIFYFQQNAAEDAETVVNVLHLKRAFVNQDLVGKIARQVNQI
jgi:hypothetical protein